MSTPDIQAHIRRVASAGRDTERIGPFLATYSRRSPNPFLNYAIPDAGSQPTPDEVLALAQAYEARGLTPRLEYLPGLAPAVEAALTGGGFAVDERLPLMVCRPDRRVDVPVPAGVEIVVPDTDADILGLLTAQHDAYGDADVPGPADVARVRRVIADGGPTVYARDAATGDAIGGGGCDPSDDGITELTGVAVRDRYRRRGIAAALTSVLTRAAHEAGAHTVFLTPAGAGRGAHLPAGRFRPDRRHPVHLS